MKAANIDGPFDLLAACPMFNMLYCEFVFFWTNKMLACLFCYTGIMRLYV